MKIKILTFLIWVCFLSIGQAADVYRPGIGGYQFGTKLYTDPVALAMDGQCGEPSFHFDHIVYTPVKNSPFPAVTIYCLLINNNPPPNNTYLFAWSSFYYTQVCPQGVESYLPNGQLMCRQVDMVKEKPCQTCPSQTYGNPINLYKKQKIQKETDYVSNSQLEFFRIYSSTNDHSYKEDFSPSWRHNYSMRVYSNINQQPSEISYYQQINGIWSPQVPNSSLNTYAYVRRPDGTMQYFQTNDNGVTWQADADVNYKLSLKLDSQSHPISWQFTTPENNIEIYNGSGEILSINYANGENIHFLYSDNTTSPSIASVSGLLIQVTDDFSRSIKFSYDQKNRPLSMTVPSGYVYLYKYDTYSNLSSVTYPDGLSKFYYYNEPAYQLKTGSGNNNLLTGMAYEISPGNIQRYAIYRYNTNAQPISTEHAGGVDKYTMDLSAKTVTSPLGTITQYAYTILNGVSLQYWEAIDSLGISSSIQYDSNGNFSAITDYNGNITKYIYDKNRNLRLSKTEGSGTSFARTTTTEWHSLFRLPTRIAEPLKITTMIYDEHGWLMSKSVQATSDKNGALVFSAPLIGNSITWKYTYNDFGKLITETGPRTDVNEITKYSYDELGNLETITNALGQITRYYDYDADGRVGGVTDPNGKTIYFTYTNRGKLASVTNGDEKTTYSYDGADDLVQVAFSDGKIITYGYDSALRLINVSDNIGNTVNYTLDNAGNRVSTKIVDPNGALIRQTNRIFNTLGRLTQEIGGMQ